MFTIQVDRILLRPFERHDIDDFIAVAGQHAIADSIIRIPQPCTEEVAESLIEAHQREFKNGRGYHFAITKADDPARMIGYAALSNLMLDNAEAELSFWVGKEYSHQGFVTESARALLSFGFTTLNLNRITAYHKACNTIAAKVMNRLGMKREGVLRQKYNKHGVFYDIAIWSILSEDWLDDTDYIESEVIIDSVHAPFAN
jgi:RimJ/RimL family protein N-acetyltransferase